MNDDHEMNNNDNNCSLCSIYIYDLTSESREKFFYFSDVNILDEENLSDNEEDMILQDNFSSGKQKLLIY